MLDYSLAHWLTFFSAAFILTLSPGPDLAFILAQTVKGGRQSGFAAMLGIWGGTVALILLVIIGLLAMINASALAFAMVKWGGVLYLIWLGLSAFRASEPSLSQTHPMADAVKANLGLFLGKALSSLCSIPRSPFSSSVFCLYSLRLMRVLFGCNWRFMARC